MSVFNIFFCPRHVPNSISYAHNRTEATPLVNQSEPIFVVFKMTRILMKAIASHREATSVAHDITISCKVYNRSKNSIFRECLYKKFKVLSNMKRLPTYKLCSFKPKINYFEYRKWVIYYFIKSCDGRTDFVSVKFQITNYPSRKFSVSLTHILQL